MTITDNLVLRHSSTITWRQYLKSVVIEPGFALNETAAEVFTRIDGKRTVGDIAREIAVEYSVDPSTCHDDVHELVGELVERGFVVEAGASGSN
jgi:hypothetical protein